MVKLFLIIILIITYMVIGIYINWVTEPNKRFKFKNYTFINYMTLVIDILFWPIEAVIYYLYIFKINK